MANLQEDFIADVEDLLKIVAPATEFRSRTHSKDQGFWFDTDDIRNLLKKFLHPVAVYTPLGDMVAINSYYREAIGFSDKHIKLLREGELRSQVLRVYLDPEFGMRELLGETQWQLQTESAMYMMNLLSTKYVLTSRYKQIMGNLKKYPEFEELWQKSTAGSTARNGQRAGYRNPIITFQHPKYGAISLLKLTIPPSFVGGDAVVFGHMPSYDTYSNYLRLQAAISDNRVDFFDGNWLWLTHTQANKPANIEGIDPTEPFDSSNGKAHNRRVTKEMEYGDGLSDEHNEQAGEQPQMRAITNTDNGDSRPLTFHDENARLSWEIRREIHEIVDTLPAQPHDADLQPVTFSAANERRGLHALFAVGTVVGTGQEKVVFVPQRSLTVLDKLGIPYEVVPSTE